MDFIMGGIIQFGGNFAPKDWSFCKGQLMPISQNQALFAILGTTFGGDGRTNFALPDLRGRVSLGAGRGIGLTDVIQGRFSGVETQVLRLPQMPAHTHTADFFPSGGGSGSAITATATVHASTDTNTEGNTVDPTNAYWALGSAGLNPAAIYTNSTNTTMADGAVTVTVTGGGGGITGGTVSVGTTGSDAAFSIMQPGLGMEYIIAIQGLFPSRN